MQLYPGPSCYQSLSLVSSLSDANQEAHLYLPEVILCPNPRHLSFILNTWPTVIHYLELYTLGRLRAHPRCGYHAIAIHSGRHRWVLLTHLSTLSSLHSSGREGRFAEAQYLATEPVKPADQVAAAVAIKMVVEPGRQVKLNYVECFAELFDHRTNLVNIWRIRLHCCKHIFVLGVPNKLELHG